VAQVSKPAVSPASKPAQHTTASRFGNLRHGRLGSLRHAKQRADSIWREKLTGSADIFHALCVEFSRTARFSAEYRAKCAGKGPKTAISRSNGPMASSVLKENSNRFDTAKKTTDFAGRLALTTKYIYETKLENQNGSVHPH
jgi:hypothetical protein